MKKARVQVIISHEALEDHKKDEFFLRGLLLSAVLKEGYNRLDGTFYRTEIHETKEVKFLYFPSERDILFKSF